MRFLAAVFLSLRKIVVLRTVIKNRKIRELAQYYYKMLNELLADYTYSRQLKCAKTKWEESRKGMTQGSRRSVPPVILMGRKDEKLQIPQGAFVAPSDIQKKAEAGL